MSALYLAYRFPSTVKGTQDKNLKRLIAFIRLACVCVCRAFLKLFINVGGLSSLWVVLSIARCTWIVKEKELSEFEVASETAVFLHGPCLSSCLHVFAFIEEVV